MYLLEYFLLDGDIMQEVKNDAYNLLEQLINETKQNYEEVINGDEGLFTQYPFIQLSLLFDYTEALDKINKNLKSSIFDDIMNIDKICAILGNVYQNFVIRAYDRLYSLNQEAVTRTLLKGLKQQYLLMESIEERMRIVFLNILTDEIDAFDDAILRENLADLGINITFKYRIDPKEKKQHRKNVNFFFKNTLSSNKENYFYRRYLDELIIKIIDTLLSMSDEDLVSDYCYTKSIALTILLRSIFFLIDSYEELIPYEEYYNKKEKQETRAKKMVREAFIKHYEDSQKESLKKLVKQ